MMMCERERRHLWRKRIFQIKGNAALRHALHSFDAQAVLWQRHKTVRISHHASERTETSLARSLQKMTPHPTRRLGKSRLVVRTLPCQVLATSDVDLDPIYHLLKCSHLL